MMAKETSRIFETLEVSDSYRILKIICGGNARLAEKCEISYHWVDRWGGKAARGGRHKINPKHWPDIIKASKGLIDKRALEVLDARTH